MPPLFAASGGADLIPPFGPNLIADVAAILGVDFMRHAFLAATVLALLSGTVGYVVVLRRLVFAGDALSHVAFTGALGAAVVGLDPLLGLLGLTALGALGIGALGERRQERDQAVGVVLAWVLALGVLFLSLYTARGGANAQAGVDVLFGSILSVDASRAWTAALVGLVVLAALLVIARPLLYATLAPEAAAARGVPVRTLHLVFLVLLALTVGEAVQVVGVLLLFALLVLPAGVALQLTSRPLAGLALAGLLALLFAWLGLFIGFYLPYPVSFLISTLAFLAYLGVRLVDSAARALARSPSADAATLRA